MEVSDKTDAPTALPPAHTVQAAGWAPEPVYEDSSIGSKLGRADTHT
jgi:hypothetical protein